MGFIRRPVGLLAVLFWTCSVLASAGASDELGGGAGDCNSNLIPDAVEVVPGFLTIVIEDDPEGTRSISAADLDGDGDLVGDNAVDLVVATSDRSDDRIVWYENGGVTTALMTEHLVSRFDRVSGQYAIHETDPSVQHRSARFLNSTPSGPPCLEYRSPRQRRSGIARR